MTEPIIIEKRIISVLSQILSVPVMAELPKNPVFPCVVIEKTAGGYDTTIEDATIAVQSYGLSMLEAAELNEQVKWAMLDGLYEQNYITKVTLNTDYNFTDTTAERYRYQAVFDIKYYR